MHTTPISTLPDFTKFFVLECDSLGRGIQEVLMQEGCPLELRNKKLCDCNLGKYTYDKEMMAIFHAMEICTHIL